MTRDQLLDAPLSPAYPTGYLVWINHADEIRTEAILWYQAATGRIPAPSDIAHGLWRAINECDRWGTLRAAWQNTWPKPVPVPPPAPVSPVVPWTRAGLTVVDPAGTIQKLRGVTAFDAFRLFDAGELATLEAYAAWTRGLGADTWRIFTMWAVTNFASTPERRAKIPAFVQWCLTRGIRPWIVGFCDQIAGSPILLSDGDRHAHWDVIRSVAGPRTLIEEWNERFKNDADLAHLDRFSHAGLPLSCRSSPDDGNPAGPISCGPFATFTDDHTPRDAESSRKFKTLLDTARLAWNTGLPAFSGEPQAIQLMSPEDAADYAAGCELMGQGSILHDNGGGVPGPMQLCKVPTDPKALAAIDASRQSWGLIPPEFASIGSYSRDDQQAGQPRTFPILRCDSALRTYGMTVDTRAVVLCPGGDVDTATAMPGWRITDRKGYKGRIVFLARV
jgi:hypothetical protein